MASLSSMIAFMFIVSGFLMLCGYNNGYSTMASYIGCLPVSSSMQVPTYCSQFSASGSNANGNTFGLLTNGGIVIGGSVIVIAATLLFPNTTGLFYPMLLTFLTLMAFPYEILTTEGMPDPIKFMFAIIFIPLYIITVINWWKTGEGT